MKSTEKLCWAYMTAGSIEEARNIGRILVKQKLVACVNILENITSNQEVTCSSPVWCATYSNGLQRITFLIISKLRHFCAI